MDTSQYFYRNVIISKASDKVSLIDIYNPDEKGEALEGWLGLVLQLADGQHTIEELFQHLSRKYNRMPPANLKETVHSVVERLAKLKFIVLTKEVVELPYYLSLPYEQLDIDKAKKELEEDKINKSQE